ncbi:MAG: Rieske (2Fe-2S) protein [Pontixanthobacter sp.]
MTGRDTAMRDVAGLHYLGQYERELPVSLARMMENAYDWAHLPHVHPSSFADIALIDEGDWGWHCRTVLPPAAGGGTQELVLRVDRVRSFWATTVLAGAGAGVQIHTQARGIAKRRIAIDVRFYVPQPPQDTAQGKAILAYLQTQYAGLYDEDAALMNARQTALDAKAAPVRDLPSRRDLGAVADLDAGGRYSVDLAQGTFVVRRHGGAWIAHAAVCPHMLGPLDDAPIADGTVVCPWHGYAFAIADGAEVRGRCGALAEPPPVEVVDGHLIIGV